MGLSNDNAGTLSAQAIVEGSWFYSTYMSKKKGGGRRPLISSEFFDFSKENQQGMTLLDKSLAILIPLYGAEIYTKAKDPNLRRMHKGLLRYISETATSVDGFQDLNLQIDNPQFKTGFLQIPLVTIVQNPTQKITFRLPSELSNYAITEGIRHWMNAISDEYSRVAHYNGLDIPFNNWSHSAGMAYIKPDKTFKQVQTGAIFFMMIPSQAPISNFSTDATSVGIADLSLEFSVSILDVRNIKVRSILTSLLHKYRNYIVVDSTMYGLIGGTALDCLNNIDPEDVMNNMGEE